MWEATVIKADRYDWQKQTKMLPGFSQAQHKLWLQCWENVVLMDIHHFPLWEKGVHDVLQTNFPVLMRIFSHYTKGISGIDSAADALEMELEEFHDFVKEAKLETRLVGFTLLSNAFAKADAARTAEAFEHHQRERRNSVVGSEQRADEERERNKKLHAERMGRIMKTGPLKDPAKELLTKGAKTSRRPPAMPQLKTSGTAASFCVRKELSHGLLASE